MTHLNPLELARQGNPKAIAFLINRSLQPKGITAKVNVKGDCLQVLLEAVEVPDQQILAPYVLKGVRGLGIEPIQKLIIYGRKQGETTPTWTQEFELKDEPKPDVLEEVTPIPDPKVADKEPETADKKPETLTFFTSNPYFNVGASVLILVIMAGLMYISSLTSGSFQNTDVTTAPSASSSNQKPSASSSDQKPSASSSDQKPSEPVKSYPDKSLTKASALEWQKATYENKYSTCVDIISALWNEKLFKPSIQNRIRSMDDIEELAKILLDELDDAMKENPDPIRNKQIYANQSVSGMASATLIIMDWIE
ncbi:hypothetical protein J5X98_01610 [Leptothermofonsia sichuanensis E412]|uniref:hypothetical protein n=1 Tax=Leptothermofonsia sichuanensis TaxID=2917832 RepID=UPI001CA5F686|nr:hypothetical protein [Leptothermofonsia sichuanensis]QZZ21225.1 hypothetical protein J5X98_01610 [Leptothermofonsia sichuanensis E412]